MTMHDVIWGSLILVCVIASWFLWGRTLEWGKGATTPAWCQGCNELQPTASMGFTEIGLYRCDWCADRNPVKKAIDDDREKMQALAAQYRAPSEYAQSIEWGGWK